MITLTIPFWAVVILCVALVANTLNAIGNLYAMYLQVKAGRKLREMGQKLVELKQFQAMNDKPLH